MAQITWVNSADGNFDTAADWSGGAVPGASDDAILGVLGGTPYTVTATGPEHVGSLQLAANATLAIHTTFPGIFEVDNGTGGGTNAGLIEDFSSELEMAGTFDNQGSVALLGGAIATNGDLTFTGGGTVSVGQDAVGLYPSTFNITNIDNTFTGSARINAGNFFNGAAGVIDDSGGGDSGLSGGNLHHVGTITNDGLIENTAANDYFITAGTIDQSGGGVILCGNGASMKIWTSNETNVPIVGGTLKTTGSGVIDVRGCLLDGTVFPMTILGTVAVDPIHTYGDTAIDIVLAGSIINDGVLLSDRPRPPPHADMQGIDVQGTVTLAGAGEVSIGEFGHLGGTGAGATLINAGNTIIGDGQLGLGALAIVNEANGVIEASGAKNRILAVDIGKTILVNAGLIEAPAAARLALEDGAVANTGTITAAGAGGLALTNAQIRQYGAGVMEVGGKAFLEAGVVTGGAVTIGGAGLVVARGAGDRSVLAGSIVDDGRLEVEGGTLVIGGSISGTGRGVIAGGVLEVGGAFQQRVNFIRPTGTLALDQSRFYGGAIYGFAAGGGNSLDLRDIAFGGGTEASYSGTTAKGVLTVTDGTHTAHITLVGDYLSDTFAVTSDGSGGSAITVQASTATFAASMAGLRPCPAQATTAAVHHQFESAANRLAVPVA